MHYQKCDGCPDISKFFSWMVSPVLLQSAREVMQNNVNQF